MTTMHGMSTARSDQLTSMQDLYLEQLRDLYSAENMIIGALPKMIEMTTSDALKQGFQMHLDQTKEQASRLRQIFQRIGQDPGGVTCKAMQGLIAEAQDTMKMGQPSPVMDAALIAGAQRVEHYEIAGYGTACTFAKQVGDTESIKPLEQTLQEEKATDVKLTQIAEGMVNVEAATTTMA